MHGMREEAVIIGNPASGRVSMRRLKLCAEALERGGMRAEVWPTERPKHATELATLAGARLVVAAGGDGTINEVINGLHREARLGILPLGTANVLARELGIPLSPERACRRILEGRAVRIDLGVARDASGAERRFACMAGIGFDASVVLEVTPGIKRRLRRTAFALMAFKVFLTSEIPPFEVSCGGERRRARFAIVANGHNYGGDFWSAEHASLTNGRLEVVLVERVRSLLRPDILATILAKRPLSRRMPSVSVPGVEARPLGGSPVPVQLDGEAWGRLPMSFRIEPSALTVLR
ncbi:diacylglycerol kinase [Rubrobacter xylanophilus]|uniref:Diacylglycerol kinase n=1 Tax=Rubrobacter xylanophilus TaxID=49319 RepID=A0A510HHU3_9ACTN|nr:diacylglycerol kinase family protein [Rubrobacter xylanophilus]BBL78223.1 diacylglycerol kinase [Rubrobacter xylanophilus]